MKIWCLDDRPFDHTGVEVVEAALKRKHTAALFRQATEVTEGGYGFTRLAQHMPRIDADRKVAAAIAPKLRMIQDETQRAVYDNKIAQTIWWGCWMPPTSILATFEEAAIYLARAVFPIVSKSSEGSASHNVRFLETRAAAEDEIAAVFEGPGLPVTAGPDAKPQKDYLLWQHFIPHGVTWRVTIVGTKVHIYKRFCYADRPAAAPSKVIPTEPVTKRTDQVEALEKFSRSFFKKARTKWCAIDVLYDEANSTWRLLETALGWARGDDAAGNAPFFDSKYSLLTQHDLLIEEIEFGVFDDD